MNYFFLLLILFSHVCYAGIKNELLLKQYDECIIDISHSATPDSVTGTIIFKSYRIKEGIHYPCYTNEKNVSASLKKAIQYYSSRTDLKPITSIMIGRLIRYHWIKDYLENNPAPKSNHQEFNKIIFNSSIIEPFKNALDVHNYYLTDVSCEKILINDEGFSIDALCWLEIEK